MKAIRVYDTGGPEVMELVDVETPSPGPGEVLVRVEAAGVNFIDIYYRTGQYNHPLPIPLGLEGAGVVEAVGQDVRDLAAGDRVAWARGPGSYATHLLIKEAVVVKVPEGVDAQTAAATMLQGMTAHYLAMSTYPIAPGEICLVHAAAGGVGLLLCQIAKRAGAYVIGTVSTEDKAARAKAAGADDVILYKTIDFEAEVRKITQGRGVSVAYDSVGKDTFLKSLACLRRRGMLVLYGQSSGAVPPFDPQLLSQRGSVFLTRPTLGDYTVTPEELAARAGDLFRWIKAGELTITVGATFPLAQAALAHEKLGGRETVGKVLLIPGA
jgi:NADPH2:quinone reductase